ncbi:MFS transporter [Luteolibacter yonseiensis]|uniref:MFS transporter n=1 Tax=Luteolibacter yonseiensis TaxID=1144680 RepID=A0A934R450_9BACT|nr:MFS transporter [Luteolibacter yonseiensis]MBK1818058.1 MFS transporter [Luteolibacter yonseiensis]
MNSVPSNKSFAAARVKTLIAVMFCYLFYYTGRQNFGFAIPGMIEELHLTKTQLGWCGAAMLWCYAIGQAINGPLADRFGGRSLMTLGGALSFIMNWAVSLAGGMAGVLIPWSANGLVQSMGWAPGSRILSNWWDRGHRGRVYGWYLFAAGSSSVLTYLMAAWLVDFGWRWIFRLPVALMLVGSVVFWLVVRDKPSQAGFVDLPEEPGAGHDPVPTDREMTLWERYRIGLSCTPFLFGCAAIGFQSLARYGLLIWVPVYFLGDNWKESPQKWISVALPVGMALGALTAGWISDRIFRGGRAAPVILFLLLAAVFASSMGVVGRHSMFAVPLLFLTGFFVYGPQSAFWALAPDLLGKRMTGTGTGMMNFFAYLFAGLGEPLTGYIIQTTRSTHMVFPVVAVSCVLGALLMSFVRIPK